MNRLFVILYIVWCTLPAQGQKYQKAIITDINFILQTGATTYEDNFPFYFNEPGFITDVCRDIQIYTKEKFGVDTTIFMHPDSIYYLQSYFAPELKVRNIAKALKDKNTLFISVETLIREAAIINGVFLYRMVTRIKVYRGGGKKIAKFKNQIPFETYSGEEIAGNVQMKEYDFYAFYFDGIEMAFDGIESAERRYIEQPVSKHFKAFRNQAEKYYLQPGFKEFMFGFNPDSMQTVLSGKLSKSKPSDTCNYFSDLTYNNLLKDELLIDNPIKLKQYVLKLKEKKKNELNTTTGSNEIYLELNIPAENTVAELTYTFDNSLKGELHNTTYSFKWNNDYAVLEFYADTALLVLINYVDENPVLFMHQDISELVIDDYFILMFCYHVAFEARIKNESSAYMQ